jgi:hypothetical protein
MNSEYKKAVVIATKEQLELIGIDEDLTNIEVKVYDIDKFKGIGGLCSTIVVDNMFEHLKELGISVDYMVPTKWLKFLN